MSAPRQIAARIPRFAVTRRAALAAALLAPLWLLSGVTAGLVVAAGAAALLVAALVLDAALTPSPAELEVTREAPSTVGLGDPGTGVYRVRSRWPRAVTVRLYDRPPDAVLRRFDEAPAGTDAPSAGREMATLAGDRALLPPFRVPARGERTVPFTLAGRARGVHALGPVALRVRGPLGLAERTVRVALADEIVVAPSVAGVRRYRLLALQHRLRETGVRTLRRRGEGTSFAGMREYVVGDDPRRVDWKATARRGRVITREYAVEQGQTVMVVVDAGRLMTQLAGPLPRFEYALSSALVLADVALGSGDQVGAMVFDDGVRRYVAPARGRPALRAIRDALVPVQATMAEPDYSAAFRTLAQRHRRRSLLVIFTDVIDPRASQALLAHVARGATRHLPLVVALRNEALLAAATPGAALDVEAAGGAVGPVSSALFAAAAAEELISAREDAIVRMRRAGVEVVDVAPTAMTAAVVNRYLDVKARAAL